MQQHALLANLQAQHYMEFNQRRPSATLAEQQWKTKPTDPFSFSISYAAMVQANQCGPSANHQDHSCEDTPHVCMCNQPYIKIYFCG
jgi:hypothetical protein